MSYGYPAHLKRTYRYLLAWQHRVYRRLYSFLAKLSQQYLARERRGVDRTAELVPKVGDGAYMIFVCVGGNQTGKTLGAIADEQGIGHFNTVKATRLLLEGHAAVDHQPLTGMAIKIEVHADFTTAAQR